jgi:hypothetical protein
MNMKRILLAASIGMFLATVAFAQDSSLGDYARQARKQKTRQAPAAKTFDNDNLPRTDKLSVVGQTPESTEAEAAPASNGEPAPATPAVDAGANAPASANTDAATKTPAAPEKTAADEKAEKEKMFKEWQKKIHSQQEQIDMLTRELDIANREYRLRAAAFYADAGNRLRNAVAWDKEDTQFKDQISDKQKKLDDAKKNLEDLQEQARRAGVPSSMRE